MLIKSKTMTYTDKDSLKQLITKWFGSCAYWEHPFLKESP